MRLSIRYWLRRWLVPELEPSPQEVARSGIWSGHEVPNVLFIEQQFEDGRKAMAEMEAILFSEVPPKRLH